MSDRIDTAIDHVAARMVAVPDDEQMTLRIVSALPDRRSRLRWLIPQLAAIGAMVIAAMVWTTRNNSAPATRTLPSSNVAPMTGLADAVAANEPGTVLRTLPLESASARNDAREPRRDLAAAAFGRGGGRWNPGTLEPMVRMEGVDHERALAAIEALSALSVADAQTSDIALPAAIDLASIDVADLKLTAESFTTQKEE